MKFGRLPVRLTWSLVVTSTVLAGFGAAPARADEQRVSRLGLAISAMVTSLDPELLNRGVDRVNEIADRNGTAGINKIHAAAFFQAEARFFISDRLVAVAGVGKVSKTSELELLPTPDRSILHQARMTGVPRHLGLDYYFTPYTRGDFTLRPFVGGGFMDVVEARAKIGILDINADTVVSDQFVRGRGEGPGYYLEAGTHLMLPSRYSFIVNVHYRNVRARNLRYEDSRGIIGDVLIDEDGQPAKLDFSGFGLRLAINMNLWNKF